MATAAEMRSNHDHNQAAIDFGSNSTVASTSNDVQFEQQFFNQSRTANQQINQQTDWQNTDLEHGASNRLTGHLDRSSVYE